ncbi:formylglycine-generating enzyme family protein [Chitinophaga nivalis]|uniref:Formylglycine-generating enzyme family protein n=1 Tax=Chitinophaga nivalis TaxID=2991709 RepID=A0ABT3IEX0_9BACT|nr:formylglycine-generating enzyme family protein [Chitinophaga nivalis]MCW3467857.1 formylglycine-generating enzyme family protein [Chitinophaga nivalis]MCW3482451.1 formylglycine-generating enzyme family protein [Chitinophaga nivalis]
MLLMLLGTSHLFAQSDTSFVLIPAGTYTVGSKENIPNPQRQIHTDSFYIAATELTNAAFAKFVAATGYITDAEKYHSAMVFIPGLAEFQWLEDSTAYWRYPNGISRGGIENKMQHPVTTISYRDAMAYCQWAHVRLPSLEEWEIASRAGATTPYFWGSVQQEIGTYANVWHGRNHLQADSSDGYMYTAPVASFKPNAWGLYDMYGNIFEFCTGQLPTDPKGRNIVHARGGSWWCSQHACSFFNSVDIGRVSPRASFSNQGFRVVKLP